MMVRRSMKRLLEEPRDSRDQTMRRWLQDDGRGGPLLEGTIDSATVEHERDPPIHEPPAHSRTVTIAEIEIEDARRQVRRVSQIEGLVEMRSRKNAGSGILQPPREIKADQRLILDDQNGPTGQARALHNAAPRELFKATQHPGRQLIQAQIR
jgi:hypothetical protein